MTEADPTPNEVVYTWDTEHDLLVAIGDVKIPQGYYGGVAGLVDTVDATTDADGSMTITLELMKFSLIDGAGEPLKFPLRLVSATQYAREFIPPPDRFQQGEEIRTFNEQLWEQARSRVDERDKEDEPPD